MSVGPNERRIVEALSVNQIALLIIAAEQVSDLIADSRGVAGLHLNGDIAPWDEVLGDWLDCFDAAMGPIRRMRSDRLMELERLKNARWNALNPSSAGDL